MMPTTIAILTANGLRPAPYRADSLTEAAYYEPSGIYTVTRTYQRTAALKLDAHLDRMAESAQLENISLKLDRAALRATLRTLIEQSGYAESRFRITVPQSQPDHFIITLEPFLGLDPALKTQGVSVATILTSRNNPQSKDTAWITQREAVKANAQDAYEYLIVNEYGQLLEGFGSNFYAILGDQLWTAPDGMVLGGIARQIVLDIASHLLPVCLEPIHQTQVSTLEGAFLTSSSRGIIPIVEIDGHTIADGKPSAVVQTLDAHYDTWVDDHIEPI